jgi:hypothetical protein
MGRRADRHRSRVPMTVAVLSAALAVGAIWYAVTRTDPTPTPTAATTAATATTLPQACADALALAREMAVHVEALTGAANGHVNVMELLELTVEGKPGGIDGSEAFRRSGPQMRVMAAHGPDAQVQVRRFQEVEKKCPLK